MRNKSLLASLTIAVATAVSKAGITYDQPLASPDGGTTPGWYTGSGNPNAGFTVDTEGNVEVGLRAKLRNPNNPVVTPTGNLYVVPEGTVGSDALWNYDFSIDLAANGVPSGYSLSDITADLTVTDNNTHVSETVNAITYFGDDNTFGTTGAQNSENAAFGSFPLTLLGGEPFNPNGPNDYTFDLTVDAGNTQLASDSIEVSVPEPASFSLIGVGALALLRRRRRQA